MLLALRLGVVAAAVVAALLPLPPALVERAYSTALYPAWQHAATSVSGVEVLRSEATRRKVTLYVGVPGTESEAGAKGAITAAVGSATEILLPPPQVAVRIVTSGSA